MEEQNNNNSNMDDDGGEEGKGNSHDLFMQNRYLLYDFVCVNVCVCVPPFFRWLVRLSFSRLSTTICSFVYIILSALWRNIKSICAESVFVCKDGGRGGEV